MKSRRVALLVEIETDATLAELEKPGALDVAVTDAHGTRSHACTVLQVDANSIRHGSAQPSPAQPI